MNIHRWIAASLLALAPLACGADELLGSQVLQTARGIERGYRRSMGALSGSTLEQTSALALTSPFSSSVFAPRARSDVFWSLTGVNADQSVLCLKVTVNTVADWNQALVSVSKAGLSAASAEDCVQLARFPAVPETYPAQIAGVKILDRRDTPVPTVVPSDPQISGVDASAVTRPGLLLNSTATLPASKTIVVTNPEVIVGYSPGPPSSPLYRRLTLTKVVLRDGFYYDDDCQDVGPNATCNVTVSYAGASGDNFSGSARLEFSNGAIAVIGLLGRTR
jgi:hypothetical protein